MENISRKRGNWLIIYLYWKRKHRKEELNISLIDPRKAGKFMENFHRQKHLKTKELSTEFVENEKKSQTFQQKKI